MKIEAVHWSEYFNVSISFHSKVLTYLTLIQYIETDGINDYVSDTAWYFTPN